MRPAFLLLALALLAVPATAQASTAGVQGTTLTFTAGAGERNVVSVSFAGSRVRVTDSGAQPVAGAGCTLDRRTVSCPRAGLTDFVADLADQRDRLTLGRSVTLRSRVRGGSGNDSFVSGSGPDELDGGSGFDVVSYQQRTEGVIVTLAGGADDGAPGEGDNLISIAQVNGTGSIDVLTGGPGNDRLEGRGQDDQLDGGPGDDTLVGGPGLDAQVGGDGDDVFLAEALPDGSDAMQGGAGVDRADFSRRRGGVVVDADGRQDDGDRPGLLPFTGDIPLIGLLASEERDLVQPDVETVRGGSGDDVLGPAPTGGRLEGRAGTDVLAGGPGPDLFDGGDGFDRILARDENSEGILCGNQVDRAFVDILDRAASDCEDIFTRVAVRVAPVDRLLVADGTVSLRVSCPAQAAIRCVGRVRAETVRRVRGRPVRLGVAGFNIAAGTSADLALRVGDAGREAIDRFGGTTRIRLVTSSRDEAGPGRDAIARFVLRRG